MKHKISALVMLGESGSSKPEQLVHQARRKSAIQTVVKLSKIKDIQDIIIAVPSAEKRNWFQEDEFHHISKSITWDVDSPNHRYNFGHRVSSIVQNYQIKKLLYLGGGSMPLLQDQTLRSIISKLSQSSINYAITNNLHSSDWIGINNALIITDLIDQLPRDNMFAWLLKNEYDFTIESLKPSTETLLDIDTPNDLLALRWHPNTEETLRSFLINKLPTQAQNKWINAAKIMSKPGSRVTLIGRVSPQVSQMLQAKLQVWTRIFSEERGMTARKNNRIDKIQSIIGNFVDLNGADLFFENLDQMIDVGYMDTRVYLAQQKKYPTRSERFASDLYQTKNIKHQALRKLVIASLKCNAPIILGAHGSVSGGLYALIDCIKQQSSQETNIL
tara:strand:- start:8959 stop:10122 length:1164 start_codon:yes stop_codon:yes gene_type:complete